MLLSEAQRTVSGYRLMINANVGYAEKTAHSHK